MGTRKLYDFIDNNPSVEVHPVKYVNNPTLIMKNYKMTCINSCIQLDLRGKSVKERGRALINIAHPDFREERIKYWKEKFNI